MVAHLATLPAPRSSTTRGATRAAMAAHLAIAPQPTKPSVAPTPLPAAVQPAPMPMPHETDVYDLREHRARCQHQHQHQRHRVGPGPSACSSCGQRLVPTYAGSEGCFCSFCNRGIAVGGHGGLCVTCDQWQCHECEERAIRGAARVGRTRASARRQRQHQSVRTMPTHSPGQRGRRYQGRPWSSRVAASNPLAGVCICGESLRDALADAEGYCDLCHRAVAARETVGECLVCDLWVCSGCATRPPPSVGYGRRYPRHGVDIGAAAAARAVAPCGAAHAAQRQRSLRLTN